MIDVLSSCLNQLRNKEVYIFGGGATREDFINNPRESWNKGVGLY